MNLKSLLLSSDDKTVRVLRRVLSDLEISIEHCPDSDAAVRRITRQRFEAIIVDCAGREDAGDVLRAAKAAPVNKRALSIVLVENDVGLKGGFEMGAHFVLHKPLAVERAKGSFRAVRALMKSERRLQMRVPVEIPVVCVGTSRYPARTIDLCEGGMAIQFTGRQSKENSMRFSFELPGLNEKFEIAGELAWEGDEYRAGVRFQDVSDSKRSSLRKWLVSHLPENEPDDPPVVCRLKDLSDGACYLTTSSPFPKFSRVILSMPSLSTSSLSTSSLSTPSLSTSSLSTSSLSTPSVTPALRANGVVRLAHPEFGMGVEFVRSTPEQQEQVRRIVETLREGGESPELHVEPDGLETGHEEKPRVAHSPAEDALIHLFRQQARASVEVFLEQLQQHRQPQESR